MPQFFERASLQILQTTVRGLTPVIWVEPWSSCGKDHGSDDIELLANVHDVTLDNHQPASESFPAWEILYRKTLFSVSCSEVSLHRDEALGQPVTLEDGHAEEPEQQVARMNTGERTLLFSL